jgi:hypothetical protein
MRDTIRAPILGTQQGTGTAGAHRGSDGSHKDERQRRPRIPWGNQAAAERHPVLCEREVAMHWVPTYLWRHHLARDALRDMALTALSEGHSRTRYGSSKLPVLGSKNGDAYYAVLRMPCSAARAGMERGCGVTPKHRAR